MWIINGDFKRKDDPKYPLNRQKHYTYNGLEGRAIRELGLFGYKDNELRISVWFNEEDFTLFKTQNLATLVHMQSFLPVTKDDTMRMWNIQSSNKDQLGLFLKLLLPIEPEIQLILPDIYSTLGINVSLGVFFDDLKHQAPILTMKYAVEAQDHLDYDLIWNLANFYQDEWVKKDESVEKGADVSVTIQQLFDFYNAIIKTNPHYAAAQTKMFELLCLLSPQNEEDRIDLLEKKLFCLIDSDESTLTDNIYHELCGYPYTGSPFIDHVKGDPDTLINLARTIRAFNQTKHDKMQVSQTQVGFFEKAPLDLPNTNVKNDGNKPK